ncbi:hypothetical protein [Alkalibacillus salilacus]|uniref:DUF4181 domain-containing protein n=1 Tax=Alkalibacillus salilacus TaxID=284582 RepID=A0ABT9VG94_9BACI|nr:hypothetical protein [Alkalibacillus salilacus]MDQ0159971.1 hypothetical protein [Alkalibacillus salilacus]
MKKYWQAIEEYFEDVDKRMDNNLTLAGVFAVLIIAKIINKPFYYDMTLLTLLILVRLGWDLVNPRSRQQKRHRQTLSITLALGSLIVLIWFVVRVIFYYPLWLD